MTTWGAAASRVLKRYALGKIREVNDFAVSGGFSDSRLYQVATDAGLFALKRLPQETDVERIRYVHQVVSFVRDTGCAFVAAPRRDSTGASLVCDDGHFWEITPWMPGRADFNSYPSLERLQSAMVTLAEFHQVAARWQRCHAASPGIAERLVKLESFVRQSESRGLLQACEQLPHRALLRAGLEMAPPLARELLARIPPKALGTWPLQPVIRDIWHEHILFSGEIVTGLIDFHALRVDTPCLDLARLVGSLRIDDRSPWGEAVERYSRLAPLPAGAMQTIRWLHACNVVLGLVHWAQWLVVERRMFANATGVHARLKLLVEELARGCEWT